MSIKTPKKVFLF